MSEKKEPKRELWVRQIKPVQPPDSSEGETVIQYRVYGATNITDPPIGSILDAGLVEDHIATGVTLHIQ